MASTIRVSSFLPTIKCSNCNAEIPISMMAEHVCAPAPPLPESRLKAIDGPFAPPASKNNMPPPLGTTKTEPPNFGHGSTYDSFLHSNPPPPALHSSNTSINSRSASPAISGSGRRSPYPPPLRSTTSPLPTSPPSPDLSLPQDSAFPIFPTSRSRSATPTTPSEASFSHSTSNVRAGSREPNENDRVPGKFGARDSEVGSVTSRSNSIAPGLYRNAERGEPRQRGHKKTTSMSSSRDFVRHPSSVSSKTHLRRPSTSSSVYTRNPSISSTSGSMRYTLDRSNPDIPAVPAMPPPVQPLARDDHQEKRSEHEPLGSAFDFGSFGLETRAQTFPKGGDQGSRPEDKAAFHRRPSEPSTHSHKSKPSVAAAVMQPLHEIGSASSFKPSKSIRGRNRAPTLDRTVSTPSTGTDGKEGRDERKLADAPPLPIPSKVHGYESGNPYHTPHESTSSNESYSSGARTGSSRSSPPLHDSPRRSNTNSTDNARNNDLFNGFQFDVERRPSFGDHSPVRPSPETGYLKPRPTKPPERTRPAVPTLSPYSQSSRQNESPITSPEDYLVSPLLPENKTLHVPPSPMAPPPKSDPSTHHRPRIPNKGPCRGCSEPIKGKSVSSADGRLTGRYHKTCFVCKTCRSAFPGADFYVWHNDPYCARHYHELNDSLCNNCDRGIEGQYVETDGVRGRKFHPHCFSCQECHRILRHDYFEWNGRTLCEQHAFRAAQQPSSLGPGRRFPERRTTKLMMM